MKPAKRASGPLRTVSFWSGLGFVSGALIPVVGMAPEMFKRLMFSMRGGGGESASWGEPVFYMVLLGFPAGFAGAALAACLAVFVRWLSARRQRESDCRN